MEMDIEGLAAERTLAAHHTRAECQVKTGEGAFLPLPAKHQLVAKRCGFGAGLGEKPGEGDLDAPLGDRGAGGKIALDAVALELSGEIAGDRLDATAEIAVDAAFGKLKPITPAQVMVGTEAKRAAEPAPPVFPGDFLGEDGAVGKPREAARQLRLATKLGPVESEGRYGLRRG